MVRQMANPTGKHKAKRRRHGDGTVVKRRPYRLKDGTLRQRRLPWAAVVPYLDAAGRRREMWLSAGSKDEADDLLKDELDKIRKGIIPTAETVGEYVNAWLGTLEVGPGTWPTYKAHVTERIAPTLGAIALTRVTPQAVRSAMLRWTGAPATRAGTLRLLRAAMKQAVADRAIEFDPTAGIPYPTIRRTRHRTLTGDQARDLMALVKGERFAPILVVSLGLGLRRGEALGLRTQDIDLAAGTVAISRSLRYIAPELRSPDEDAYRLTATKTHDDTTLPLPGFVADALRDRLVELEQEQRAKVYAYNDFVFCDELGGPIPVMRLYRWWKATLKRAGLPDMRWHDLRGSTATVLAESGVDIETIRRILRHRDIATTLRYVGDTPGALTGAATRLDEAMG